MGRLAVLITCLIPKTSFVVDVLGQLVNREWIEGLYGLLEISIMFAEKQVSDKHVPLLYYNLAADLFLYLEHIKIKFNL